MRPSGFDLGMRFMVNGTETDILSFEQLRLDVEHGFLLLSNKKAVTGDKARGRFWGIKEKRPRAWGAVVVKLRKESNDEQAHHENQYQPGQ